jgi:hypothetical protein
MAAGTLSPIVARSGTRARCLRSGPLAATANGSGSSLGDGPGSMLGSGGSRRSLTGAGSVSTIAGLGARQFWPCPVCAPELVALSRIRASACSCHPTLDRSAGSRWRRARFIGRATQRPPPLGIVRILLCTVEEICAHRYYKKPMVPINRLTAEGSSRCPRLINI